jgi:hypothetical protein
LFHSANNQIALAVNFIDVQKGKFLRNFVGILQRKTQLVLLIKPAIRQLDDGLRLNRGIIVSSWKARKGSVYPQSLVSLYAEHGHQEQFDITNRSMFSIPVGFCLNFKQALPDFVSQFDFFAYRGVRVKVHAVLKAAEVPKKKIKLVLRQSGGNLCLRSN